MHLIGIPLRKPSFAEFTAAAVMASGLFVLAIGVAHALAWPLGRADAGALLVVLTWACVSARVGIHVGRGQRHLVANLLVSATLLGAYQAAWAVVA
jgi:hypothetical protein